MEEKMSRQERFVVMSKPSHLTVLPRPKNTFEVGDLVRMRESEKIPCNGRDLAFDYPKHLPQRAWAMKVTAVREMGKITAAMWGDVDQEICIKGRYYAAAAFQKI